MKPTTDAHGQPHVELSPRLVDRDINLRGVAITVAGIVALTAIAALAMLWVLGVLLGRAEAADPTPPPAVAGAPRELPPGPRLQSSPERDWDRVLAEQEQLLSSYGRTADGRVRIPIDRAIDVLAARGGAVATGTAAAAPAGGAPGEGTVGAAAGAGAPAAAQPAGTAPSAFGTGDPGEGAADGADPAAADQDGASDRAGDEGRSP